MSRRLVTALFFATLASGSAARAAEVEVGGPLVSVAVELDGRQAALHPARDGSGRYYLEARAGSRYALRLASRSATRVGVVLTVDGLAAISGRHEEGTGRMYILDPWSETVIRGWRLSLAEVRSFTFVDERRSYAARTGQMNGHVGWIEVAVHRERPRPIVQTRPWSEDDRLDGASGGASGEREQSSESPGSAPAPAREERSKSALSHPGTGWGEAIEDGARLVEFDPYPTPCQRVTLRYEYAPALRALGILPEPRQDRLTERERGEWGFARAPRD